MEDSPYYCMPIIFIALYSNSCISFTLVDELHIRAARYSSAQQKANGELHQVTLG